MTNFSIANDMNWLIIPAGLFLGLLGYRLYRISFFIIGLVTGFSLGLWIGEQYDLNQTGPVLGVALALLMGVGAHLFIRFSFFLVGASGGALLAAFILPKTSLVLSEVEFSLTTLGAALLMGIVTFKLYRIFLVCISSFIGAYLIYQGTHSFFPAEAKGWSLFLYGGLLLIFIAIQIHMRKGHRDIVTSKKY